MKVVYFVVMVGVLVFVHELGHFLWARVFGVRVLTFSLGFGPRIAGFRRAGTEYVLSALPLGGYVRMLGENAAENDYTGVLPSHRNRGIAAVLKGKAIRWAQQHGVEWFYTSSSVENGPMIAIQERLGYQAGPCRMQVVRDLKRDSGG